MSQHSSSRKLLAAVMAAATIVPGPALAHHSYAAFDTNRTVQISGSVTSWEWTNPHSHLVVAVSGDKGADQVWDLEMSSPSILRSNGWSRDAFKVGDKVTVVLHPRRDGIPGGNPITVTTADGHVFGKASASGGVERN